MSWGELCLPQIRAMDDATLMEAVRKGAERFSPADHTLIEEQLAILAAAYPPLKGSPAELLARKRAYLIGLGDLSTIEIRRGILTAMRTCKFFPSIAEIRDCAIGSRTFSVSMRSNFIEEWSFQRAEAVRRGLLTSDEFQQIEDHRRPGEAHSGIPI